MLSCARKDTMISKYQLNTMESLNRVYVTVEYKRVRIKSTGGKMGCFINKTGEIDFLYGKNSK